ncbi:hypothetical protein ACFL9U_01040 [Thermodesulfobacteriota bacterium]
MNRLTAKLFSLLIFFSVVVNAGSLEGDIPITGEGYGLTKNAALLAAKRAAVEKGIGTIIISETEVRNFEIQKDVILTKTKGAVRRYEILTEEKQSDGVHYVKIKATVSLDNIQADLAALKILLESMDKPRMMVVIEETGGDLGETTILDYLRTKDFVLVDAAAVAALMQGPEDLIRRATAGDPVAAAQIGAANGAEYIIVGNVSKSFGDSEVLQGTGMKSGQAVITAKVVSCSNARIIASKSSQGAAAHISGGVAQAQATKIAAQKLMDRDLFEEIVSSFQDMMNNGITLDVAVQNVPNYRVQKQIQEMLAGIENVVTVHKRGFTAGRLMISVQYKGNPDSFGEAVDGQRIGKKALSVIEIIGGRVVIDLN